MPRVPAMLVTLMVDAGLPERVCENPQIFTSGHKVATSQQEREHTMLIGGSSKPTLTPLVSRGLRLVRVNALSTPTDSSSGDTTVRNVCS